MTRDVAQGWGMQRAVWMGIRDPHALDLVYPHENKGPAVRPAGPNLP